MPLDLENLVEHETNRDGYTTVKAARKLGCHIVTYEWLTDTLQLLDYHKRKAPPELYHPRDVRDGEAISALFRKTEKKCRPVKEKSRTATESTAMSGEDEARAGEAAEDGPNRLATSEEERIQRKSEKKEPPKPSYFGERKVSKAVDDTKRLGNPVSNKSDKAARKPEDGVKHEKIEPSVDLSRFIIYRDDIGPYQTEVFYKGRRHVLELYESRSAPKTYLFSSGVYPKPASSKCIRHFPSKTPRDKERELRKFKSYFWRMTEKRWRQPESNLSNGSSPGCQPRPVPKTTFGSANYKKNSDGLEKFKKEGHPEKSLVIPREQRQVDLKTSFKRKSSFSETRPAKELKVTKYSIAGRSDEAKNGGSKTA